MRAGWLCSAEAAARTASKGRAVPLRDLLPASALPERGRFDLQSPQVHVPLGSMVDLVVYRVEEVGVARLVVRSEGHAPLLQAFRRDPGPGGIYPLRVGVPLLKEAGLGLGDRPAVLEPLAGGGTLCDGSGHAHHLSDK